MKIYPHISGIISIDNLYNNISYKFSLGSFSINIEPFLQRNDPLNFITNNIKICLKNNLKININAFLYLS